MNTATAYTYIPMDQHSYWVLLEENLTHNTHFTVVFDPLCLQQTANIMLLTRPVVCLFVHSVNKLVNTIF